MSEPQEAKSRGISRRNFLKTSTILASGSMVFETSFASALIKNTAIALLVIPEDEIANAMPPIWALGKLRSELEARGSRVRLISSFSEIHNDEFCIAASGMKSPVAAEICSEKNIAMPVEAEALCLVQGKVDDCPNPVLLAAGTDELVWFMR